LGAVAIIGNLDAGLVAELHPPDFALGGRRHNQQLDVLDLAAD
jgi:hypothetical protein